jgi:hypothetical protein
LGVVFFIAAGAYLRARKGAMLWVSKRAYIEAGVVEVRVFGLGKLEVVT